MMENHQVIVPRKYLEDLERYKLENESRKANDVLSHDRESIILRAKKGYEEAKYVILVDTAGKIINTYQ
jgi:hypothetical protein